MFWQEHRQQQRMRDTTEMSRMRHPNTRAHKSETVFRDFLCVSDEKAVPTIQRLVHNEQGAHTTTNIKHLLKFPAPTQLFIHGQWWSIRLIHRLQIRQ